MVYRTIQQRTNAVRAMRRSRPRNVAAAGRVFRAMRGIAGTRRSLRTANTLASPYPSVGQAYRRAGIRLNRQRPSYRRNIGKSSIGYFNRRY